MLEDLMDVRHGIGRYVKQDMEGILDMPGCYRPEWENIPYRLMCRLDSDNLKKVVYKAWVTVLDYPENFNRKNMDAMAKNLTLADIRFIRAIQNNIPRRTAAIESGLIPANRIKDDEWVEKRCAQLEEDAIQVLLVASPLLHSGHMSIKKTFDDYLGGDKELSNQNRDWAMKMAMKQQDLLMPQQQKVVVDASKHNTVNLNLNQAEHINAQYDRLVAKKEALEAEIVTETAKDETPEPK